MKAIRCKGEGQGSCKRCSDKGKWNRTWMCFLYEIEGYEGCYCRDCVKEILDTKERNTEQIIKVLECCITDTCISCPYDDVYSYCIPTVLENSLALIKEQQAEIERLKLEKAGAESGAMMFVKELQAHNENLKKENKYLRERLVEEAEIKEDMEGKDGH